MLSLGSFPVILNLASSTSLAAQAMEMAVSRHARANSRANVQRTLDMGETPSWVRSRIAHFASERERVAFARRASDRGPSPARLSVRATKPRALATTHP